MHITFLIGNGFDRNLGLDTTYTDFVKVYKNLSSESDHINGFRDYIKANEALWSKAEEALGQYTQELERGQGPIFSECQADFCANLAQYLKRQESRVNYDANKEAIQKAFQNFRNLVQPFSSAERNIINSVYQNCRGENIIFDFIDYNYTYTLDRCLQIVKNTPGLLGEHSYYAANYKHTVGKVCHVHGTVDGQMVFGVNDNSQIAKPEVFEENDGDLSKALLIKKLANESYGENSDATAAKVLEASNIIYVYGMALGITDTLWWERICEWLTKSETRHLILHQYEMPSADVVPYKQYQFERQTRRNFCKLGNLPHEKWTSVENRIHITSNNIFEPIKDIASPLSTNLEDPSPNAKDLITVV